MHDVIQWPDIYPVGQSPRHSANNQTEKEQNSDVYYARCHFLMTFYYFLPDLLIVRQWIRTVLAKEGILEDNKKQKYNLGQVVLSRTDTSAPDEKARIYDYYLVML